MKQILITMTGKGEHLEYISHRGLFHLGCDPTVFTKEEIDIIEKWGHWFTGLTSGELKPITEIQVRFIRVVNGELTAVTPEEVAWLKYQASKAVIKQDVDEPTVRDTTLKERIHLKRHKKKSKSGNYNPLSWDHRRGLSEK